MRRYQIFEILADANKSADVAGTVSYLRQYSNDTLRLVLSHAFDPNIKYKLPEGAPDYKLNAGAAIGLSEATLYSESRRMQYLWHNPPAGLKRLKLEMLFIGMLESLHPEDSKVIVAVKDKNLTSLFPKITEAVVREAFPGLLPAPVVVPEPVVPPVKKTRQPRKPKEKSNPKKNGKPKIIQSN